VLAAVDGAVAEVEVDDPVIGRQRFGGQGVEHAGCEPLVAATAHGRVGHGAAEEPFGIDPRAAGDEADQDAFEAHPVWHAGAVTTERVPIDRRPRQQALHGLPDGIDHLGPGAPMMLGASTWSSVDGQHPV
jgi:hypothetical protein